MEEDFEDRTINEEDSKEKSKDSSENPEQFTRVKLPRKGEIIGIIEERLGGNRMMVACSDKIKRNCRVPGRLKRKLWLRPGDIIIVKPWEFDNSKADVLFKYNPTAISWLKKNSYLQESKEEF